MALERGGGTLPGSVHRRRRAAGRGVPPHRPSWGAVAEAHEALHHEIVVAADSARLTAVHAQAGAELRLFVLQLPPSWTLERIAADHLELVDAARNTRELRCSARTSPNRRERC